MADFPNPATVGNVYNVGGIDFLCTGTRRFKPITENVVVDNVALFATSIVPVNHVATARRYYSGGDFVDGLRYFSRGIGWPAVADNIVNFADSKGNFLELLGGAEVDIRQAGAAESLVNNAPRINALLTAFAGSKVVAPDGVYNIQATVNVPANTVFGGAGRGFVLKKNFNGDMLNLGKLSQIEFIKFDGSRASRSGAGVVINTGANTPVPSDQGHQVIHDCQFVDMADYPIKYTANNLGWMSKVINCQFTDYSSTAAILWPDEPSNGGNRTIQNCYSNSRLVNVNGADNGYIHDNVIGGAGAIDEGVYFPPGTTHRAKKVHITNNRFGIASGTVNLRGADLIFKDNSISGSLTLYSDASNDGCVGSDIQNRILTGNFLDASEAVNYVDMNSRGFTPAWGAGGSAPSFGNADVRCSYTRKDNIVTAYYYIVFGSTTTFGTGGWLFSLPVNRVTGVNTDYVGNGIGRNAGLTVRTLAASGLPNTIQANIADGTLVSNTVPSAWASGDTLIMRIEYAIF
jgi:hypothetical protein